MRRLAVVCYLMLAYVASASAAEPEMSAKLTAQEWQAVGDALGNAPYRIAAPIVEKLRAQLTPKDKPAPAAGKTAAPGP